MSEFTNDSDSDEELRRLHESMTNELLDCLDRVERLEETRKELNGEPPSTSLTRLIPLETPEHCEAATKLLRERVANLEMDFR